MSDKADVWQGTLALMVLKTLESMGPLHGYGIARRIEQTSGDLLSINYGTLYPALLKLEQEGYIWSEWGTSDNNRKARYYKLTRAGRKRLATGCGGWPGALSPRRWRYCRWRWASGRTQPYSAWSTRCCSGAVIGIYGVITYSVNQRTREIGIRMAMGAGRHDVFKLVIGQAARLTLAGIMAGVIAAYVLTRFLSSLLFGVSATDPATYAAISLILAGVALVACFVPARRATRVDPIAALRYE